MNPPPAAEDDLLPPPPVDDDDELPAPDTPDDCPEFDESDTPGSPPPPMSSSRFPNRHTPSVVRGIACHSEDDLPSPPESPYVRLTKGFRSVLSSSKSCVAAMPSTDSCDGPGEDVSSPPTEDIDDANYQHNHRHQQQSRALTLCDEDDDLSSPPDSEDERDMNLRPAQDVDFETPLPSPKQHANGSNQPSSPKQIIREGEISVENEAAALTNAEVTAVEGGASDRPGSDSNSFLAASGDGFTGSSSGSLRGRAPRRRHSDVDRTVSASADLAVRRSGARLSVVRGKNPAWITARQWKLGQKIGSGSFGGVFQGMNDKVSSTRDAYFTLLF